MSAITVYHETPESRSRRYTNTVKHIVRGVCKAVRCPKEAQISVVFVSDKKMRELNRQYRGKDKTTNVLAFPYNAKRVTYNVPNATRYTLHATRDLGDIFISLAEARREAKKYGWTVKYSVARLALHGFLHLLGYDHVKESEAQKMERVEKSILKKLI